VQACGGAVHFSVKVWQWLIDNQAFAFLEVADILNPILKAKTRFLRCLESAKRQKVDRALN